jgi:hypothetical protein
MDLTSWLLNKANLDKIGALQKKTNGVINIEEYDNLIPNKNTSSDLWDWSDAIQKAVDDASQYSYTVRFSNRTYGISKTVTIKPYVEFEGLSKSVIKALDGFTGDAVLKSQDYDNSNIYSFGIFSVAIDGNWQNVYGLRLKLLNFGYSDLLVYHCKLGGLNTDRNATQPLIGGGYLDSENTVTNKYKLPRYYKSGRFEGRGNGGTTFYWNHINDSWIGEIECRGVDYAGKIKSDADVSQLAIHIGPQGQCEIERVHVYGFKDCMKVQSRITAELLILESYFDRAILFDKDSTFSQIDKLEVFQNMTPTGNFTTCSEGRNDVPAVHINAWNGVQINNLFIRQYWADPEKINDTTAASTPAYKTILDARKTKKCLVIDSDETHIGNLHIVGKRNGDTTVQKYYPIGVEINGSHNRIESGQVNFCSLGLVTKSLDTGYNFVKLNFYYTTSGWKNILGTGSKGGNKYHLTYRHDLGGANSLFTSDWADLSLDKGERMKYYWTNGDGNHFNYPSIKTKTYDLSAVIANQMVSFENKTGKVTKPEEIDIQILTAGSTTAVKNCSVTMANHTKWASDLYFDNSTAVAGASATVRVKIGIE